MNSLFTDTVHLAPFANFFHPDSMPPPDKLEYIVKLYYVARELVRTEPTHPGGPNPFDHERLMPYITHANGVAVSVS